jgi:hypothetical protein
MTLLIDAPALNGREVALAVADEERERHWLDAECWCRSTHDGTETGLTFTAPPWDESRAGEAPDCAACGKSPATSGTLCGPCAPKADEAERKRREGGGE